MICEARSSTATTRSCIDSSKNQLKKLRRRQERKKIRKRKVKEKKLMEKLWRRRKKKRKMRMQDTIASWETSTTLTEDSRVTSWQLTFPLVAIVVPTGASGSCRPTMWSLDMVMARRTRGIRPCLSKIQLTRCIFALIPLKTCTFSSFTNRVSSRHYKILAWASFKTSWQIS